MAVRSRQSRVLVRVGIRVGTRPIVDRVRQARFGKTQHVNNFFTAKNFYLLLRNETIWWQKISQQNSRTLFSCCCVFSFWWFYIWIIRSLLLFSQHDIISGMWILEYSWHHLSNVVSFLRFHTFRHVYTRLSSNKLSQWIVRGVWQKELLALLCPPSVFD